MASGVVEPKWPYCYILLNLPHSSIWALDVNVKADEVFLVKSFVCSLFTTLVLDNNTLSLESNTPSCIGSSVDLFPRPVYVF